MSKININDITTQYGFKDAINARLQQIEAEFNNKVFYRNNPTGEPNSLNNDLDMGNNDILNINKITVNDIGVVGESSFKELIEEAKQAVIDCTEQATLSTLQANASAYSAGQSSASAAAAATSASEAQAAADMVDPRMDAVEVEVAAQTTSINTFKNDVSNLFGALIGSIQSIFCSDSYVPLGMVPANGAEYTRSQFPDLYDNFLVGGKLLTTDYTSFTTQIGLTGNCAKFALDTVNQKFKVPLIKDGDSITHAASAAELGKSYKAGLPNIIGKWLSSASDTGVIRLADTATGAIKRGTTAYSNAVAIGNTAVSYSFDFDASASNSTYGNSTTVTDEQVRLRHFVVLASAQNNASVFDWSNYMAALAGKANADLNNATGNAMKYYLHVRDEKAQGVSGGSTTSGAWNTRDLNTIKVNRLGATLASNRVTVPAGTYYLKAIAPCFGGMHTRLGLYNVTAASMLCIGPTGRTNTSSAHIVETRVEGEFTFAVQTTLELRMYTASGNTYGMGYSESPISGFGEVYSEFWAWKI